MKYGRVIEALEDSAGWLVFVQDEDGQIGGLTSERIDLPPSDELQNFALRATAHLMAVRELDDMDVLGRV